MNKPQSCQSREGQILMSVSISCDWKPFSFFSQETSCEGFFLMAPVTGIILLCTLRSAWALLLLYSRKKERNIPQTFLDTQDFFFLVLYHWPDLIFFFFFAGAGVGRGYVQEGHNPVEETEQESQNFLTMNDLPLGLDVLLSAPRLVALHPRTLRSLGLRFPESSFHGVS